MKTYIVKTDKGMIATMAENKQVAFEKVSNAFTCRKVYKTGVLVSACHLDYCSCEKLA